MGEANFYYFTCLKYSKSDRTKEKTMSYLKTTCWAVGTVATLLILYSQRRSIAKLLLSRKAAKKRGMVKSKKLDDEEDYVVSYFEQGQPSDSPSLVLFHGFTSTKGTWRAVLENFPDSLHVIAVDLPGHGSTTFNATDGFTAKDMAMRMHQLTQSLGLKRIHIGGQSLGGVVAVVYASLYADQVASAVIICPGMATAPEESPFYRQLSAIDDVRDAAVRNYLIPETPEEMKFFLGASVKNKKLLSLPEAHLLAYLEKRKQQNLAFRHMWNILCVEMKDPNVNLCNLHMGSVQCPTLVVWGDTDDLVHPHGAEILGKGIANSKVVIVPDCGHSVTVEKPQALANHILEFLSAGSS